MEGGRQSDRERMRLIISFFDKLTNCLVYVLTNTKMLNNIISLPQTEKLSALKLFLSLSLI